MAVIDWWNGPLTLVVIFFELCLLLLTWSSASVACRACHSSGTFFIVIHTHTCCLLEVSPVSLVVLAIHLALFFIVTHTRGQCNKKKGVATTHRFILRCLTQLGFEALSVATTQSIAWKTGPSFSLRGLPCEWSQNDLEEDSVYVLSFFFQYQSQFR